MSLPDVVLKEAVFPVSKKDWNDVYDADSYALPTQSSAWASLIANSTGFANVSRMYRFSDGADAVLPLFASRRMPPILKILRSPPAAWGFGGTIASRPLSAAHMRYILDDCASLSGAAVQVRPNPLQATVWDEASKGSNWQRVNRSAHVIDLEGGFDEVWNNRFPGRTRNKIRKTEKLGMIVETGSGDDLIAEFDTLFRRSLARWARRQSEFAWLAALRGRLRDPKQKFLEMAQLSEGMMRISIARLDGRPVAGIMVLVGKNAHYTRGAMDERYVGNTNASFLLQKVAIQDACQSGCRHYHMGETGASASLAQFKSSFGATAVPYAEYRHERIPLLSADQKLRSVIKRVIGFQDA